MKNAIECFKYLFVNGYDDPIKIMKEDPRWNFFNNKQYKWDCMATAIYYGNNEIIKILEGKGSEKGNNISHIEAAIQSYRNIIAKDLIEKLIEEKEKNQLNVALISSANNNNIKVAELLIRKGININATNVRATNVRATNVRADFP